jgi:hypothetical protein
MVTTIQRAPMTEHGTATPQPGPQPGRLRLLGSQILLAWGIGRIRNQPTCREDSSGDENFSSPFGRRRRSPES